MRVIVKKWGNSAAVRIPNRVMHAADLRLDEAVEIREHKGRIIIEPIRHDKPSLADLLAAITKDNLHGEVDFGTPVGNESL